jgi:acyl-CoA thioesterase-1
MIRSLVTLLSLTVAACAGSDAPAVADGSGSDSTMVVATGARVPSKSGPRVVFLGTSITAGLGLEREAETYVSVLAELADSAGRPFQAINAGVSGETSAGGLRRLDWILREPLDVLVIELGGNDGLRGQSPDAMADNLTEIIRRTRTRYPDALFVVAGMEAPPNLGEAYTSAFRAVFPTVAAAEGAVLVPFLLDGVAGVPELNQDDRIHPTPEGHRRIASTVWPILRDVLDTLPEEGS